MSILSNYTPECLVRVWVECDFKDLEGIFKDMTGEQFARKFETAVKISEIDIYRATTHNKGVFNGVDAVAIAHAVGGAQRDVALDDGREQGIQIRIRNWIAGLVDPGPHDQVLSGLEGSTQGNDILVIPMLEEGGLQRLRGETAILS